MCFRCAVLVHAHMQLQRTDRCACQSARVQGDVSEAHPLGASSGGMGLTVTN